MKKIIYCVLVALITISCSQDEDLSIDNPSVAPETLYAQTPDFESRTVREYQPESWEDSETVDSRTYAVIDPNNSSEYFQYWSEGNAISVFFTTQNLQYTLQSYRNGKLDEGIFTLTGANIAGTALKTEYYYSVYPYKEDTKITNKGKVTYQFPTTQNYSEDSYANGENGMIAIEPSEGTDSVIYFQNFCSYLQLRLATDQGKIKKVKKITLVANNVEDKMAGEGTIEINSEGSAPIVKMKRGATNQITLECGEGVTLSQDENAPTKFWFVLPGDFTFTEGFSITAVFDDNSTFKKSTGKSIIINRNHIKPMATLKPETVEALKPIRYKYKDSSITTPYPLSNTFYGADGSSLEIIDQEFDKETGEWVVLLSDTLISIGGNSFKGPGSEIEYITIDSETKEPIVIDDFAFYNCPADSISIKNNVSQINESAFTGSSIQDLVINGDVTTIKNSAGTGSHIENLIITGDVGKIENQAFVGCEELKTINIDSVKEIEELAFSGCKGLQSVNINNIETIGYRAFYMCSALKTVNITGVKTLAMGAFRDCIALEIINLDDIVIIDDNAFMDCSSLTSVVISKDCTMIGEGAFCNAINLQQVYCYAVNPPFIKTDNHDSSYAFDNVHENISIYIPMGSSDIYTDDEYFVGNTYNDPSIEAEVNWWYEEYDNILVEMEN